MSESPEPTGCRVLLVHGTGAAREDDAGDAWWQRGSAFDAFLLREIGATADSRVSFHWSGRNSERDRARAAVNLFCTLQGLERDGLRYHLVGHSHGGSVIFGALREAARRKVELSQLASVTTVGTPFLTFAAEKLDLLLGSAAAVWIAGGALALFQGRQWLLHVDELVRDHLYYALTWLPGLWIVTLAGAGYGAARLFAHVAAAATVRANRRTTQAVGEAHAQKWLILASQNDEAIGGLASTLHLGGALMPRPTVTKGTGGGLVRLLQLVYAAYDRIFARATDAFVWDRIRRSLQGNDLLAMQMVSASHAPGPLWSIRSLGEERESAMLDQANLSAAVMVGKLRTALGLAAIAGTGAPQPLSGLASSLTWRELIHTSYFDDLAICTAIANHIVAHSERPSGLGSPSGTGVGTSLPGLTTGRGSVCAAAGTRALAAFVAALVAITGIASHQLFRSLVKPYAALEVPTGFSSFVSLTDGVAFAYPAGAELTPPQTQVNMAVINLTPIGQSGEFTKIAVGSTDEVRRLLAATDSRDAAERRIREGLRNGIESIIDVEDWRPVESQIKTGSLEGFRLAGKIGDIAIEKFPRLGEPPRTTAVWIDAATLIDYEQSRALQFILTTTDLTRHRDQAIFEKLLGSAVVLPSPRLQVKTLEPPERPTRSEARKLLATWLSRGSGQGITQGLSREQIACGLSHGLWSRDGGTLALTPKGTTVIRELRPVMDVGQATFVLEPATLLEILEIRNPRSSDVSSGSTQIVRFTTRAMPPGPLRPCFHPLVVARSGRMVRTGNGWALESVE